MDSSLKMRLHYEGNVLSFFIQKLARELLTFCRVFGWKSIQSRPLRPGLIVVWRQEDIITCRSVSESDAQCRDDDVVQKYISCDRAQSKTRNILLHVVVI